jgi:hypothetical protein
MSSATLPATVPMRSSLDPKTLEKVVVQGDLSQLTSAERLAWYRARCEAAGLDPLTQPFQYIVLDGRLTLYATKGASEQLRKIHGISVTKLTPQQVGDIYIVTVEVRDKEGRSDCSTGAVSTQGLKGMVLANAFMKAETKAKRRATLSICGLGMLDESEIESMPVARVEPSSPDTGRDEPRRAINESFPTKSAPTVAKPEPWASWIAKRLMVMNTEFRNHQKIERSEKVGDLASQPQMVNFVASLMVEQGIISGEEVSDPMGKRDLTKAAEHVSHYFTLYPDWVKDRCEDHFLELWSRLCAQKGIPNPHEAEDTSAQDGVEHASQETPGGREPGEDG